VRFFDLTPGHGLGEAVANAAGTTAAATELRVFGGGEHKLRPLESVRGGDVYVFATLHAQDGLSANDLLIRLLFFLAACRDHGAARVTAVVPCLPYARKDRVTKARDPLSFRYVAQLLESIGFDALVTVETHNLSALQMAFRKPVVHVDTALLFSAEIALRAGTGGIVVASPDGGGIKRAELLRQAVEQRLNRPVGFAMMEKHRSQGVVSGALFAGDVAGCEVYLVDDMIESGGTLRRAAAACHARGAAAVHLLAGHLMPPGDLSALTGDAAIASVTVLDTAVRPAGPARVLSVAPTLGRVIRSLHLGEPVGPHLDPTGPDAAADGQTPEADCTSRQT
jgi:ribose-phosphate pyrophosphokinase